MSSHKQSILSALLANPKKFSNENEKSDLKSASKNDSQSASQSASQSVPLSKSINKPSKEDANKPSKEEIIADGSKMYYSKIIDEQNKKIEYLENQLKEASNRNLIRLIQEYI